MSTELQLNEYSTTPLYNIKAVVQATGISSNTLRAWERRYDMVHPQRSGSGYRLYSDRDIAIIRWLKAQVDAGMAISQAVSWLGKISDEAESLDEVSLPLRGKNTDTIERTSAPTLRRDQIRDLSLLEDKLLQALLAYNEAEAERLLSEAFSMYSVEEVGEKIVQPVMQEVGERWHRGELNTTTEHFASNYLQHRMSALLRTTANGLGGPMIWVGCAPTELHELGILLLTIYLRRSGYQVQYLGQNLNLDDFAEEVAQQRPAMVLLTASTAATAGELAKIMNTLTQIDSPRPLLGYGGQIFNEQPELRSDIPGIFMGASAHEAIPIVKEVLTTSTT